MNKQKPTASEINHALHNYQNYKQWEIETDNKIREHKSARCDELIASLKHYQRMIKAVDDFIYWLEEPYKQMLRDKYINRFELKYISKKYGYNDSAIYKIIKRNIKKYIII